jgi:hypothetical protein
MHYKMKQISNKSQNVIEYSIIAVDCGLNVVS